MIFRSIKSPLSNVYSDCLRTSASHLIVNRFVIAVLIFLCIFAYNHEVERVPVAQLSAHHQVRTDLYRDIIDMALNIVSLDDFGMSRRSF